MFCFKSGEIKNFIKQKHQKYYINQNKIWVRSTPPVLTNH